MLQLDKSIFAFLLFATATATATCTCITAHPSPPPTFRNPAAAKLFLLSNKPDFLHRFLVFAKRLFSCFPHSFIYYTSFSCADLPPKC